MGNFFFVSDKIDFVWDKKYIVRAEGIIGINHNEGLFGTHQYFVETEGLFGISNAMTIYLEGSIWIFEGLFGFANLLGVYLAQGSIWKKLIDGPNGMSKRAKIKKRVDPSSF